MLAMSESLRFTIRYSDGGEGWTMAQVEQVPGAISQGRTRSEARENVIDALRLMLKPEPDESADPDREPLESLSGDIFASCPTSSSATYPPTISRASTLTRHAWVCLAPSTSGGASIRTPLVLRHR